MLSTDSPLARGPATSKPCGQMGPGETGLDKWFDAQLHPESIDEADLNARLAEYPAMQWSTRDLMFRMPGPAIIRQAADGKIDIPQSGILRVVYENQIYRYQMRKAAQAEKQTAKNQGQGAAGGVQSPAMSGGASMDGAVNQGASPNMEATSAQPAAPQQPDMSAASAPAMNAMTPAATQSGACGPRG